jgi:hypothetical protein
MGQSDSFPPVKNSIGIMDDYYRHIFERYVEAGILTKKERRAAKWYLSSRHGGRLAALNAVRELRSHHLDELMKENK